MLEESHGHLHLATSYLVESCQNGLLKQNVLLPPNQLQFQPDSFLA